LQWQAYVLYVDYVLSLISLVLISTEFLLSIALFLIFLYGAL